MFIWCAKAHKIKKKSIKCDWGYSENRMKHMHTLSILNWINPYTLNMRKMSTFLIQLPHSDLWTQHGLKSASDTLGFSNWRASTTTQGITDNCWQDLSSCGSLFKNPLVVNTSVTDAAKKMQLIWQTCITTVGYCRQMASVFSVLSQFIRDGDVSVKLQRSSNVKIQWH